MMSEQERRLAAKIADALAHRLTSEENAYVKGIADGMVFSREIKEMAACSAAKLANA